MFINKYDGLLCQSKTIREFEKNLIQQEGISESYLMQLAGLSAFKLLQKYFPTLSKITVCCGGGNNAGDGYVLAKLAHESGYQVRINHYKPIDELPPAAKNMALAAVKANILIDYCPLELDYQTDLFIDGLIGIGLKGEVNDTYKKVIQAMNESQKPILSLDIPSGLEADTGKVMGICIEARITITFILAKLGLYIGQGMSKTGFLCHDTLGLERFFNRITSNLFIQNKQRPPAYLLPRPHSSNKGDFGNIILIGGNQHGMSGAIMMAAMSALTMGAGRVTVILPHARFAPAPAPEIIVQVEDKISAVKTHLKKASCCVIGPGLGEDSWAITLLKTVIQCDIPLVIDASALRLLPQLSLPPEPKKWILTPHPGEAATLLNCYTNDVQFDRIKAISSLYATYKACIILKGAGTLIKSNSLSTVLCPLGNPGMAIPGMGDILSGVIAGLLGQKCPIPLAAETAVWLHAKAGDQMVRVKGEKGRFATEILPFLNALINLKQ